MKTFIRASEVWVPSTDRTMLEFGGGLYGDATRFAAISREPLLRPRRGPARPGLGAGAADRPQGLRGLVLPAHRGGARRGHDLRHRRADLRRRLPDRGARDLLRRRRGPCRRDRALAQRPGRVARHDARRRLLRHAPPTPSSSSRAAPASAAATACRGWPGSRACRCSSRTSASRRGFLRADSAQSRSASTAASRCRARCRGERATTCSPSCRRSARRSRAASRSGSPTPARERLQPRRRLLRSGRRARRRRRAPRPRPRPGDDRQGLPDRRAGGERQRRLRAGRLRRRAPPSSASSRCSAMPVIRARAGSSPRSPPGTSDGRLAPCTAQPISTCMLRS